MSSKRETVKRPWGSFTVVGQWSDRFTVKILKLKPRSRLSLQKHRHRDEEWLCLQGAASAQIGPKARRLKPGDKVFVPRNTLHRLSSALGTEILEIGYGRFDEEDIVRVEDDYGRASQGKARR